MTSKNKMVDTLKGINNRILFHMSTVEILVDKLGSSLKELSSSRDLLKIYALFSTCWILYREPFGYEALNILLFVTFFALMYAEYKKIKTFKELTEDHKKMVDCLERICSEYIDINKQMEREPNE